MVLAADYPFLDIFWTMILFFAWGIWFWMVVVILSDVFRRADLSGWAKAGWAVLLIVFPFIGMLAYVIRNGTDMTRRRDEARTAVSRADFSGYAGTVAADGGSAGEIRRAKELLDSGAITQQEFEQLKAKALA
jgi:hypothetical protein